MRYYVPCCHETVQDALEVPDETYGETRIERCGRLSLEECAEIAAGDFRDRCAAHSDSVGWPIDLVLVDRDGEEAAFRVEAEPSVLFSAIRIERADARKDAM